MSLYEVIAALQTREASLHLTTVDLAFLVTQDERASAVRPVLRDARQRIESLSAWSQSRQVAWTDYLGSVQRFIREVVRLDPDRATSMRLRDALLGWEDEPWHLLVVEEVPYLYLEPPVTPRKRPPPSQKAQGYEVDPGEPRPSIVDSIESAVRALLEGDSELELADVLDRILPALDEDQRYRAAGLVARFLAKHGRVAEDRTPPWRETGVGLTVEDWRVAPGERK
jgi:chromosome partition protein MukF